MGHPDGPGADLYAAVSPDLAYLGTFSACYRGRCVTVRTIDCLCSRSGIDLYADAFAQLAPLGAGRIVVEIR